MSRSQKGFGQSSRAQNSSNESIYNQSGNQNNNGARQEISVPEVPLHMQQHSNTQHTRVPHTQNVGDDEFDAFGSVALQHYELTQHDNPHGGHVGHEESEHHVLQHGSEPVAFLMPTVSSFSTTGSSSSVPSRADEVVPPTHTTEPSPTHAVELDQQKSTSSLDLQAQLREALKRIEEMEYRHTGEVKNLRDRHAEDQKKWGKRESELNTLKASLDKEIASKYAELEEMKHKHCDQMSYKERELCEEIDKRLTVERKYERLQLLQREEQGVQSTHLTTKTKRSAPPSSNQTDFPTTKTFLGSTEMMATSTPLQYSKPKEKKHSAVKDNLLQGSSSKSGTVTPVVTPTAGLTYGVTPNQSTTSSTNVSTGTPSQFSASFRSIIVPEEEGFPLLVEGVKTEAIISGPEIFQRLLKTSGSMEAREWQHEAEVSPSTSLESIDKLSLEGRQSPNTSQLSDSAQSEGILSLFTCPNPMFVAATTERRTPSLRRGFHTDKSSSSGRTSITPLHRAVITADRKRRFESDSTSPFSTDTSVSTSSDFSLRFVSRVAKINPLLLDDGSQQQLQQCIMQLLAPASTPLSKDTPVGYKWTPSTPGSCIPVSTVMIDDDRGLSLFSFLQEQIIAYCNEYGRTSSPDSNISSNTETSSESLSSSKEDSSINLSFSKKSYVDTSLTLLQVLKVLLQLVKYSPLVRERMINTPSKLDCNSEPGSSLEPDTTSSPTFESSSLNVERGSLETTSQKHSSSDQSSSSLSRVEVDTQSSGSSNLSGPGSQSTVGLIPGDLTLLSKYVPCRSMKRLYVLKNSTTTGDFDPLADPLVRDPDLLSVDGIKLNSQFLFCLKNLLRHHWCRNPAMCACVLDILFYVAMECSAERLEWTRPFLTGLTPLLYSCLKQVQSHPHVVCCTARLLTAMVPLPGIADILCAKSEMCVLLQLYNTLCDQETANTELTLQVLRLFSAMVAQAKGGLNCLFLSDCCDCSLKAFYSLVHGVSCHLPVQEVSQIPPMRLVLFEEFVSFLDCISDRVLNSVNPSDLIYVIRNLYCMFTSLGGYEREVETLAILQDSDVFLESSEDDEMDTSTLPSNINSHV